MTEPFPGLEVTVHADIVFRSQASVHVIAEPTGLADITADGRFLVHDSVELLGVLDAGDGRRDVGAHNHEGIVGSPDVVLMLTQFGDDYHLPTPYLPGLNALSPATRFRPAACRGSFGATMML